MRPPLVDLPNVTDASSRAILLASAMLLVSGLMQLATTWMQTQASARMQAGALAACAAASPPTSESVWLDDTPYTWVDDDYPATLPLELGAPVALTTEDTRHYALDSPDAAAEYRALYPGNDRGFVRLGPQKRFFGLAMFHQLHCLDSLRGAILHPESGAHGHPGAVSHSAHCLNYLREAILCAADVALEPEVVPGSQDVENGNAVTHVCRDWSRVREFAERNYEAWERFKRQNATDSA